MDRLKRLRTIGHVLAQRTPGVLAAAIELLESMLMAADRGIATDRIPTAPVVLTAEQVLEAARAHGVPAFSGSIGDRLIRLASLGLDLTAPGIRAASSSCTRSASFASPPLDNLDAVRADLAARRLSSISSMTRPSATAR
jgi:hypothetical protein